MADDTGYTRDMQSGEQHARSARDLLAGTFHGVISSHSSELEGYPFGSVVPFVLDGDGMPLMLLSHLAQHSRNLERRPQCGLTVVETGDGDIQQLSRLSAIGDVTSGATEDDMQRYFRHFPQTRAYHSELGFRFFRFRPIRFHWNAGFATARWFGPDRILRGNPFGGDEEERLLGRLNSEHPETLSRILMQQMKLDADAAFTTVGIDSEGMNLRVDEHLVRIAFPHDVSSPDQIQKTVAEMAPGLG